MFLLDTNVISELRRAKPHGAVVKWFANTPQQQQWIAAISFGEIQTGIERARITVPLKADEIERWADEIMATASVLAADAPIFRLHTKLMIGKTMDLYEDAMIAATAIRHNLIVVTRNTADFDPFPVRTFNPFLGGSK